MKFLEEAHRPWGKYQKFYQENGVWVKRVEVKPHSRLSLQKHQHRSEKWVFVAGQGIAIVDDQKISVAPGSVVDIPLGAVHRIGNTGQKTLIFIEVATGSILTEKDIVRLQDDYKRPSQPCLAGPPRRAFGETGRRARRLRRSRTKT